MYRILITALLVLFAASGTLAVYEKDQVVTWADFWHVRWIASSMNYVYFATTSGIIKYDKMKRQWEMPLTGTEGIDHNDIYRVHVDEFDDRLIANTGDGLFEYDELLRRWFPVDRVPSLGNRNAHIDAPSVMYAPSGYNYANTGNLNGPWGRSWPLSDVLDDGSGRLWMGFWGYGVATADAAAQIIELLPYGLLQERVNAMTMRDGILWVSGAEVGSHRTGVTALDIENNQFDYVESGLTSNFPIVDINCLASGPDAVWAGTANGVYRLDPDTRKAEVHYGRSAGLPDLNTISLAVRNDSVWVGTANGLALISLSADSIDTVVPRSLHHQVIYDLAFDEDELWIASSEGAYRLRLSSGDFQRLSDPEGLVTGEVYDIEVTAGHLWFAGPDGVLRLDKETGDSESYPMLTTYRDLHAIAANDTILAVASGQGLTLVYHNTDRLVRRRFTTGDGLPSNTIYSLELDGDFLWLGGDRGLTRFWWNNPDRID